jgi:tetratricopeptide (TPR) repeat protein
MKCVAFCLAVLITSSAAQDVLVSITIIDTGPPMVSTPTEYDAGPAVGDMLNAHYFPGINLFNAGRYNYARGELTYVIQRPHYLEGNPKRAEYVSTALYLRGMIYLYHAEGIGKHDLAKADFEAAIKWNPNNHLAYLELSRVYSDLGFATPALKIIDHLLKLKPDQRIADEASAELDRLKQLPSK